MERIADIWTRFGTFARTRKLQLAMALRATIVALATYLLGQALHLPLGGLWAVLTAVIVTQMSIGGSVRASVEYMVGTIGGAIYAVVLAIIIPRNNEVSFLLALALAIGPLAFVAAFNSNFRVGPFTAIIVLVGNAATQASSLESAFNRVLEVAIGAGAALVVSLLVVPARARNLAIEAAANALDLIAEALPKLLLGFTQPVQATATRDIQDTIWRAFARVEASVNDARRERLTRFGTEPDLGPLLRTLLRLRHDLVMIGRAASEPLPHVFVARLGPPIAAAGEAVADYLHRASAALRAHGAAPPLDGVRTALQQYHEAVAGIRRDGMTLGLPADIVERLFSLGFALDQLSSNFRDLERCTQEHSRDDSGKLPMLTKLLERLQNTRKS